MKKLSSLLICGLLLLAACKDGQMSNLGDVFSTSSAQEKPKKIAEGSLTAQGYQLLEQDQARAAIGLFEQAIASNPEDIPAYQGKGIALNKLGRHDEADSTYEKGLKIEPDAVGLVNNLAMSKILRGKYQEAIDVLTPIANSEEDNDTVQENLALANCLLGKKEDARKLYSKRLPAKEVEENLAFCGKYEGLRKKR